MSKSYRIKTTPGVDKNINVEINQDFDYLEILSLKISQNDVYLRNCADYGVVVGRVIANNGFGVPNARVSIFVPLTNEDAQNEIISTLYPYKTVEDINEDGYRYNLLPYTQQHGGHTPTGTFPTRNDALKNPTVVEIYDKYYKFVVRTNDSGDYMIFGVPTGTQTLVMDVDLSDIGPFSLTPNDLIRTGRATESQVSGNKFRASTNLRELPQLVNLVKTVEVDPLWGQPDLCNISIARADFDLRKEGGLDIQPTAVFMGSLISTTESDKIKSNCKVTLGTGSICDLVAGPGEVLAIRQTIFSDANGDPVLEEVDLGEGGKVIDENGTWLLDVPMNLDYVTTNEFGEQVLSNDPEVGIPTKGKYRFKIKWSQPNTITDSVKRAYFLVPNIKELGWGGGNPANLPKPSDQIINLPANNTFSITPPTTVVYRLINSTNIQTLTITINGQPFVGNPQNVIVPAGQTLQVVCTRDNPSLPAQLTFQQVSLQYYRFQQSYAFSLNWNDYPDKQSAINCEDTFYEMRYNKIYTVSQLIDQYKNGFFPRQTTAIKEITNRTCESENYRFPTNDAVLNLDLIYFLFIILFSVLTPILYPVLLVLHILAFIWPILRLFFTIVYGTLILGVALICNIVRGVITAVNVVPGVNIRRPDCPGFFDGFSQGWEALEDNAFKNVTLANLTYEACTLCNCSEDTLNINADNPTIQNAKKQGIPGSSLLADLSVTSTYDVLEDTIQQNFLEAQYVLAGYPAPGFNRKLPLISDNCIQGFYQSGLISTDLTIAEKLNLFNTKGKYFNTLPGGGWNQVKVKVNPSVNTSPTQFHYDNLLVMLCDATAISNFPTGQLFSFVDSSNSKDWNVTGSTENEFLTNSVTGTTLTGVNPTVTIQCADPNNPNQNLPPVTYIVPSGATFIEGADFYRFPSDIEYYQVVTATTVGDYYDTANTTQTDALYKRYLDFVQTARFRNGVDNSFSSNPYSTKPLRQISNYRNLTLVFMVRGVDPYSPKMEIEYDLSKIYGYNNFGYNSNQFVVKSPAYRLNVPIQKGLSLPKLNNINNTNNTNQAQEVYFNSFYFTPNSNNSTPNSYTGYSTTAYRFYSMLDNTFLASNPYPSNAASQISGYLQINNTQNLFTKTLNVKTCVKNNFTNVITADFTPGNVNGYYSGEYIEGGSIAYANNADNSSNQCNPCINFANLISPVYATIPGGPPLVFMNNPNKIVMRTDRLPSSSFLDTANIQALNIRSTYLLHQNTNFEMFQVNDDGSTTPLGGGQGGGFQGYDVTNQELEGSTGFVNSVLETFSCESMQPLDCYKTTQNGLNFTLSVDGPGNKCNTFRGKSTFKNGCYVTVTTPLLSFLEDIQLVTEWTVRLRITFALCRNVISHTFGNNWVNGTLFAYSFQNDRIFSSPFSNTPNQASSVYCEDTIVLHDLTNTFYYRSSPYHNGSFLGIQSPNTKRMNVKNLLSPTTIIDLGPRDAFTEQLSLSNEYTGYIANRFASTSYGDTSDIINLFVVSRLASQNFLRQLLSSLTGVIGAGADISSYFTRTQFRVDGDFAQAISVNSEIGIPVFSASNYPDNPDSSKQSPIFFNPEGIDSDGAGVEVFGIFFSSDTQTRDLISPRRLIRNNSTPPNNLTAFDYLPVKSQNVPFYLWEIRKNTFDLAIPGGGPVLNGNKAIIFGTQTNNWKTDPINPLTQSFYNHKYQEVDRILTNQYQFLTNEMGITRDMRGYIYNVTGGTNGDLFGYTTQLPNFAGNNAGGRVLVGAPFHFYFGLKRGKSAMDRFIKKWLDTTIEVE